VEVVELADGASVRLDGFTVKVAQNTHYSFAKGSDLDRRYASLSFRFFPPDWMQFFSERGWEKQDFHHFGEIGRRFHRVPPMPLLARRADAAHQ